MFRSSIVTAVLALGLCSLWCATSDDGGTTDAFEPTPGSASGAQPPFDRCENPGGLACSGDSQCRDTCACGSGAVSAGKCLLGLCQDRHQTCEDACEVAGFGSYVPPDCDGDDGQASDPSNGDDGNDDSNDDSNPDSGFDDGSDGAESGATCTPSGEVCFGSGECCGFDEGLSACVQLVDEAYCADLCDFDDECESGCCAPLAQGGGACGPPGLCG